MIKFVITTLMAVLPVVASAETDRITLNHLWARATAGSHHTTAVYGVFENTTGQDDALIAVEAEVAGMSHIHHTTMGDDGMMKMDHIDRIVIPNGSYVKLEPGAMHLMLMRLKRPLKAGEEISLRLTFENAAAVHVRVPVYPITATFDDVLKGTN